MFVSCYLAVIRFHWLKVELYKCFMMSRCRLLRFPKRNLFLKVCGHKSIWISWVLHKKGFPVTNCFKTWSQLTKICLRIFYLYFWKSRFENKQTTCTRGLSKGVLFTMSFPETTTLLPIRNCWVYILSVNGRDTILPNLHHICWVIALETLK